MRYPKFRRHVVWPAGLIFFFCLVWPFAQAKEIPLVYSSITASQSVAWVAQETGIYRKYGLEAQLVYISAGSRAMSALIAGETPLLFSAGSPAVSAANIAMLYGPAGLSDRPCPRRSSVMTL